jgi:hypothetical protein
MSDFDKATELITPYLRGYNFMIVENSNNYVKYSSKQSTIAIGYDERDHSYFTIVGHNTNDSISLDVDNLKDVFEYDIQKFIHKPIAEFFIDFFETKGHSILTGDRIVFEQLKRNRDQRAEKVTKELLQQQNLIAADKAWLSHNYRDFVKHLDLIDKTSLPKSYELKYSIAKKKILE